MFLSRMHKFNVSVTSTVFRISREDRSCASVRSGKNHLLWKYHPLCPKCYHSGGIVLGTLLHSVGGASEEHHTLAASRNAHVRTRAERDQTAIVGGVFATSTSSFTDGCIV